MWAFQQQSLSTFKSKNVAIQRNLCQLLKAKTWAFNGNLCQLLKAKTWAFNGNLCQLLKAKTWPFNGNLCQLLKAKTWAFQQQSQTHFKWQNHGFPFSLPGCQMLTHTGMTKTPFPYQNTNYKNASREMILFFHCQDTNTMQT
jgi:hypothetical protein